MEGGFAHDFGAVRIHTGEAAERSTFELGARAYTIGNDIVFGADFYRPDTRDGRGLLAHELAHVVQQSRGASTPGGSAAERGAIDAAATVAAGGVATVAGAAAVGIQRDEATDEEQKKRAQQKFDPEYAREMNRLYGGHQVLGRGKHKGAPKPKPPAKPAPTPATGSGKGSTPTTGAGTGHDSISQPGEANGALVARPGTKDGDPSGTHVAAGGTGVVKAGGSSTASAGGAGREQNAGPPKTEMDYATLLSDVMSPAFIEDVMALFGKKGDVVNSGGLTFGVGSRENASEGGQEAVVGANIFFAFLDSFIAAGKQAATSFARKSELVAALNKEIRAGKIASEGLNSVFTRSTALTETEQRAANAYRQAILEGKTPGRAGTIAHEVAGANVHTEGARYGQTGNSSVIKPGPDFIKHGDVPAHGGAATQELKFHAGYMSPEQFQSATAQTLADSIVYQQETGLVKLRLPTIHIYVDLGSGKVVKFLQRF